MELIPEGEKRGLLERFMRDVGKRVLLSSALAASALVALVYPKAVIFFWMTDGKEYK